MKWLPEAWFADIDQGQIYVFEVGTMKHFSFIAVMQIGLQSRRLHGTKPWAKGFLSKYSTYISEHQQFIWAQILSVTSVSKQAKSDETVVEYKMVRGLVDYSPFHILIFPNQFTRLISKVERISFYILWYPNIAPQSHPLFACLFFCSFNFHWFKYFWRAY